MLIRTTLRLPQQLKKTAERVAIEENLTLQELFSQALTSFLKTKGRREAKKIIFKTHDLGKPLDNLRRSEYYPKP